jgi:hypothetical protein
MRVAWSNHKRLDVIFHQLFKRSLLALTQAPHGMIDNFNAQSPKPPGFSQDAGAKLVVEKVNFPWDADADTHHRSAHRERARSGIGCVTQVLGNLQDLLSGLLSNAWSPVERTVNGSD